MATAIFVETRLRSPRFRAVAQYTEDVAPCEAATPADPSFLQDEPVRCNLFQAFLAIRPCPTFLLDGAACLVTANAAALKVLDEKADWSIGRSKELRNSSRSKTVELHTKIRTLATSPEAPGRRSAQHLLAADGGQTLVVLTKMRVDELIDTDGRGQCAPCRDLVLLTLNAGKWPVGVCMNSIMEAFGLTQAEAKLALALLDGHTLQSFADDTGVRISTVRWHLRNALRKSSCANQRDFVKLVMSLVLF